MTHAFINYYDYFDLIHFVDIVMHFKGIQLVLSTIYMHTHISLMECILANKNRRSISDERFKKTKTAKL